MLKRTPFYELHKTLGAKMVDFAGFEMPIQYKEGIIKEHNWTRTKAGIFDVSHMGEIEISGKDAISFVNYITSNDASSLEIMQVQYSTMPTEKGTIVDDLLVYRLKENKFLLVVNAANIEKDYNWIMSHKKGEVEIINRSPEYAQIAFQGPLSEEVLGRITKENLSTLPYYYAMYATVLGKRILISRTGYTGEDGFELYFKDFQHAKDVFTKLLEYEEVKPVALGARDTLRLEMGYCLYGNDIDETTNIIEAGLSWVLKLDKEDFIGKNALLKIKEEGPGRRRVGFITEKRSAIPRHGQKIFKNDVEMGYVTSGTMSPSLREGIGMGYVKRPYTKKGTEIEIDIRGKKEKAQIIRLPFYKNGTVKR